MGSALHQPLGDPARRPSGGISFAALGKRFWFWVMAIVFGNHYERHGRALVHAFIETLWSAGLWVTSLVDELRYIYIRWL